MREMIINSLHEMQKELNAFVNDETNIDVIIKAAHICSNALMSGHKILTCGNGGSLCDVTHFAE
jgi:Phosphoheptose isomerase